MISAHPFGALADGRPVTRYRLTGGENAWVDILDYGATIQSLAVPDQNGIPTDVVLGYDTAEEYRRGTCYFGAVIGRHANRIGGGEFTLNGKTYVLDKNSGPNHSHGGFDGYNKRFFTAEIRGDTLNLSLCSKDGDQGYPGTLKLTVSFTFSPENALKIRYHAVSDQDTVVNLTSHSYFDLSGGKNPRGQLLTLDADFYTENDENTLPTGVIAPVENTPFDFRQKKAIGQDLDSFHQQLLNCRGYDHNFVLKTGGAFREIGSLESPETGISMTFSTDLPGLQVYSGNYVEGMGKGGRQYANFSAVTLETQFFPNAMAIAAFQKPILKAGEVYDHATVYCFS